MYMMNQMFRSHSCAQRAYLFLQQLLKLMDSRISRESNTVLSPILLKSTSPSISPDLKEKAYQTHQTPHQNDSEANYNVDFSGLMDVTHDLAENLGSQLESYSTADLAMWSWMDEDTSSDAQEGIGRASEKDEELDQQRTPCRSTANKSSQIRTWL